MVAPEKDKDTYKVIGTRPVRPDGTDKVTGRAAYAADTQMTNLLYAQVLRSPHAHAIIKSINTSKALALPGVKAVITAADLPDTDSDSTQKLLDNVIASNNMHMQ